MTPTLSTPRPTEAPRASRPLDPTLRAVIPAAWTVSTPHVASR